MCWPLDLCAQEKPLLALRVTVHVSLLRQVTPEPSSLSPSSVTMSQIPEKLGLLHHRSITESFGRSDWREVLRNDGGQQVRSGLGLYSK